MQPAPSNASSECSEPRFESSLARDLHTQQISEDLFEGVVRDHWRVMRGPNGGYLAALLLATMTQRCDLPERSARVLSAHYLRVPDPGPIQIRTQILRQGRSVTWLAAELHQNEAPCVLARAAFSVDWPSVEYERPSERRLPPPEAGLEFGDEMPPFTRNFEYRSVLATPWDDHGHDAIGGYIRLRDPHPYDAPLLALMSDAWFPSTVAFDRRVVMAATLDLTVHFRSYAALAAIDPHSYVQSVFHSRMAAEGFFEEDGEIRTPSGELLAHSRQLAIATPYGAS